MPVSPLASSFFRPTPLPGVSDMNRHQEKLFRDQILLACSELRRLRDEGLHAELAEKRERDIRYLFMLRKYLRLLAD